MPPYHSPQQSSNILGLNFPVMGKYVIHLWYSILRIGHREEMDKTEEMRLFTLNGFMALSIVLIIPFTGFYVLLKSYMALQGLLLIPVLLAVFYFNAKGWYVVARFAIIYLLLAVVLYMAVTDRRTGTEYLLIAIGCCSVMVFNSIRMIIISFCAAFACYAFYKWYDATHTFTANPSTPYVLVENSIMFFSGFAVVAQSMVFRSLIKKYADSLRLANNKIITINEELKSSNEELLTFSENLDVLVKQKSAQLNAYMEAIDTNTCSVTIDLKGRFTMVNNPFIMLSGYSSEELIGKHYSLLNSGQFSKEFFQVRDEALKAGRTWSGELRYTSKDGSFFWVDCVVLPIRDNTGTIIHFLSLGIPITERKLNQQIRDQTHTLLEDIAFRTSHKIRGPLARIEGLTMLIQKNLITQQEYELIAQKLAITNDDLQKATSELVKFVIEHQQNFERNG